MLVAWARTARLAARKEPKLSVEAVGKGDGMYSFFYRCFHIDFSLLVEIFFGIVRKKCRAQTVDESKVDAAGLLLVS
jgi:hypothetical protein